MKADIFVIGMLLPDTRRGRDLAGMLIADIVPQRLSYVARTERGFIHQRRAEGIAAARARNVKFGRRPRERSAEFMVLSEQWRRGEISARRCGAYLMEQKHRCLLFSLIGREWMIGMNT